MNWAGAFRKGARPFMFAESKKTNSLNVMRAGTNESALAARLWALLLATLFAIGLTAQATAAEQFTPITRPPTYPVVLQQIRLISETTAESQFELIFDPTATTFTPALGRPDHPGIGFASTTLGIHAVQPSGMKGLVRALQFDQ